MHDAAHPVLGITELVGHGRDMRSPIEQPDNLPVQAFDPVRAATIALLDLGGREMRRKRERGGHGGNLLRDASPFMVPLTVYPDSV